ncbi:sperm flagellar protein 1 [Erpetoichthys calabaricus]|uniref:Sperm flagellar 1 n=1 Tax=Erpetoichthys calabaricus TaxID=27687 RepID=A0A8C4TJG2_ERPCA|nr:sperm flagellar protein 1 [Erpetoichthys calabaricus]
MNEELKEESLQELYAWIDQIPLSRPKRNITRDFSDGVMAAEVVKHFYPKLVELHNYIPANSTHQKLSNWATLNRKVFSKLNFHITEETIKKIINCTNGIIESVLCVLRERLEEKRTGKCISKRYNKVLPQDLEYYTIFDEKAIAETGENVTQKKGQSHPDDWKYPDRSGQSNMPNNHLDPSVRLLIEEKEQALLALQETVEILQMKVHRLEHLVQLKDLRIEDLTRHLEKYKLRLK